MAYETIIVETRGKVGLIRLNRPAALNALNRALMRELTQALDAFEADSAIGCMVITGSDKAFAAGADIKEMAEKTFNDAFLGDFAADWHRAATVRKPLIAAVAGFALGERLANADDRRETRLHRGGGLRAHRFVVLVMIRAPFAVTDDDERRPSVAKHRRGNIAGMSAAFLSMAVLPA